MAASILSLMLFVACLCHLQETQAGSYMPQHPQIMFCDSDYVFMFRAMPMVAESRNGRTKRGFMFGGYRKPKKQMVEVQRIYKGEKMMMPMMQLEQADTFSAATKIEANIELGMYQKEFKKNEKCVFFGKMRRYRNNTMMPLTSQRMMADLGNTIPESSVTKLMKRGLRKKYAKGCKQGCRVKTYFRSTNKRSKDFCYWKPTFRSARVDCRKTTQFCRRGKDGFCQWKVNKDYKRCVVENKLP